MAKTLSIKVKAPGLSVTHDFLVPADMIVRKAVRMITRILQSEYPGAAHSSVSEPMLLQASSGLALDGDSTLEQNGIVDGDAFILL